MKTHLEKGMDYLEYAREALKRTETSLDPGDDGYLYANAHCDADTAITYLDMNLRQQEEGSPLWLEAKRILREAEELEEKANRLYDQNLQGRG